MDTPIISEFKQRMVKAIAVIGEDLGTIRTGRATPSILENVTVSAYGGTAQMKVRELATITTEGPRILIITPFDPIVTQEIERGINSANLGFSAAVDGAIIRIALPPLTAERREEYIKLSHAKLEGGRVMMRQIRHEAMTKVKRMADDKEISEDDKRRLDKQIQEVTDEMMAEIDAMRERKERELREV